ncbi:hypothetical protein M9458_007393, partial [Cirrhinus mrigala]
ETREHYTDCQQENGNHPRLTQELNDNNYLAPLPNTHWQIQQPQPRINFHRLLWCLISTSCSCGTFGDGKNMNGCNGCVWRKKGSGRSSKGHWRGSLQQQQQEHRLRRQLLQRQLEMEQQQRLKQQSQVKGQVKGQPPLLSPSSGLCTIYEAMETSEEEEEDAENESTRNQGSPNQTGHSIPTDLPLRVANGNLRRPPPQELDWNTKLDMVQQLINQALLLAGEDGCPPLLYLPGQGGGILSPLESSLWPHIMSHFDSAATVASFPTGRLDCGGTGDTSLT